VQVAPVHQVEDEAELVGCLERVGHAHNEGAVLLNKIPKIAIKSNKNKFLGGIVVSEFIQRGY
jgi:hypothetical protein